MKDTFLTQTHCDRCGKELIARTMSWFTNETICMKCSNEETKIKQALRAKGIDNTMEGCGYVPDPNKIEAT